MTIRPGLCSITFRALAADDVVALAARAGVEGIEWGADGHVPPGAAAEAGALAGRCGDAGIEVVSYGSYLGVVPGPVAEPELDSVLDTAEALGAPMVRVWTPFGVTPDAPRPDRRRVAESVAATADAAASRGLLVALEFHPHTLTHTAASTVALLDDLARPNLRTHWQPDPALAPADALAELDRVVGHLAHLHVFAWGPGGIDDRHPLATGADLWSPAVRAAGRAPALPADRYALCEYVRGDDPEQLVADVATLRVLLAPAG